ncbi:MAG: pyridoxine 5'-phosphate synthase [Bacteroidota bacterium]|nr:pyridoxine 5'-phosphate synthase [Flavisolibacter sp.]MDQ3051799.1 pyridoxine 5'-phosphate synthase [Bacteroidota bacterium]
MIKLSVNINKIATLRNARGGNVPNVLKVAIDCERFGADGITVHPRPDERHIRYRDVMELKPVVTTEFNIEGYPNKEFMDLVLEVLPHQVTLVPDAPGVLTSNAGWDTVTQHEFLKKTVSRLKEAGIRTSIFIAANSELIKNAAGCGTDRIELYTEFYATTYSKNKEQAVDRFREAAITAHDNGLGVNAGHDLSLDNLEWFAENVPYLQEVSIGHALISDALYFGLENTIQMYKRKLEKS